MKQSDVRIRQAQFVDIPDMLSLLGELFPIESDFTVDEQRQRRGHRFAPLKERKILS